MKARKLILVQTWLPSTYTSPIFVIVDCGPWWLPLGSQFTYG